AMRRIVSAGIAVAAATLSGLYSSVKNRAAIREKLGRTLRPSGNLNEPTSAGEISVRDASAGAPVFLSKASGLPSASRANKPSSADFGSSITSQWALVKRTR